MRDSEVRAAARKMLDARHFDRSDTLIVEEMGLWSGSARVDLAVINGELCGLELKSERDTLDRLPRQAEIYSLVFDRVELIVGRRHLAKALPIIPKWWGVMVAVGESDEISLVPERETSSNPSPDPYMVARLLWKDEALGILSSRGLATGWRSKPVKAIHRRLATQLPFDELGTCVRGALKSREGWLRKVRAGYLDVSIDPDPNPIL
jgi:hypothetical protein